jgi:hypothetical protein
VTGLVGALGIAAIASAVGFLAASLMAAVSAASGRASLRRIAHGFALVSAAPLLALAMRAPARPYVAFAVVAALPQPQPVTLALAAGAAALAATLTPGRAGSVALVVAGVAAAMAAQALGRSVSAHLASGRDAAWPSSAAGATACGLALALDGGRVLRWSYGVASGPARIEMPDAGLVLGLALLASLAGALLLAADALAVAGVPAAPPEGPRVASPLGRMLGRRALLLGAGLCLIVAGLVLRTWGAGEGWPPAETADLGGMVAMAGLLACAVPPLLSEKVAGDPLEDDQSATVLGRLVVVATLVAVLAAGIEGWRESGTYLTVPTQRLLAASLVAFAASETTRFRAGAQALALTAVMVAVLG